MPTDACYKKVQCKDCERSYTCLPGDDYYQRPGEKRIYKEGDTYKGGVCESCLVKKAGITKPIISADNN